MTRMRLAPVGSETGRRRDFRARLRGDGWDAGAGFARFAGLSHAWITTDEDTEMAGSAL